MDNAIIDYDTGKQLNYCQMSRHTNYQNIWKRSFANELGRLAQGGGGLVEGKDTVLFVAQDQLPKDRLQDFSYGRIVVDFRPQKEEPHRTRLSVGVDLIVYARDLNRPTADITTSKLIINSTITTPRARYMCCNNKKHLLGNTINLI